MPINSSQTRFPDDISKIASKVIILSCLLSFCLDISPVAGYEISTSLQLAEEYVSNIFRRAEGEEKDDYRTIVAPSISIEFERSTGSLNLAASSREIFYNKYKGIDLHTYNSVLSGFWEPLGNLHLSLDATDTYTQLLVDDRSQPVYGSGNLVDTNSLKVDGSIDYDLGVFMVFTVSPEYSQVTYFDDRSDDMADPQRTIDREVYSLTMSIARALGNRLKLSLGGTGSDTYFENTDNLVSSFNLRGRNYRDRSGDSRLDFTSTGGRVNVSAGYSYAVRKFDDNTTLEYPIWNVSGELQLTDSAQLTGAYTQSLSTNPLGAVFETRNFTGGLSLALRGGVEKRGGAISFSGFHGSNKYLNENRETSNSGSTVSIIWNFLDKMTVSASGTARKILYRPGSYLSWNYQSREEINYTVNDYLELQVYYNLTRNDIKDTGISAAEGVSTITPEFIAHTVGCGITASF